MQLKLWPVLFVKHFTQWNQCSSVCPTLSLRWFICLILSLIVSSATSAAPMLWTHSSNTWFEFELLTLAVLIVDNILCAHAHSVEEKKILVILYDVKYCPAVTLLKWLAVGGNSVLIKAAMHQHRQGRRQTNISNVKMRCGSPSQKKKIFRQLSGLVVGVGIWWRGSTSREKIWQKHHP